MIQLIFMFFEILLFSFWYPGVFGTTFNIPNEPYTGISEAEYHPKFGGVDNQKITPWPNATSFEWWYFDVASTSSENASVVVVFYESLPEAFIPALNNSFLSASISGTFDNGTPFSISTTMPQDSFINVDVGLDSISGVWGNSGFSFHGRDLLKGRGKYKVKIDSPELGIYGSITYRESVPAHFACGADLYSSSEVILPNIGWANAIPNAVADVDIWIQEEHLFFRGAGYHDKNWGDKPFTEAVSSWYWGHAELGCYSVVWFDAIDTEGNNYVSGYVAKDGKVLQASCKPGAVKVRPYGGNDRYPPIQSSEFPEGFSIVFDLGKSGKLHLKVSVDTYLVGIPVYLRFTGKATGWLEGKKQQNKHLEGRALAEQFAFD